ncbi:MAG: hypothetical protein AAB898_01845 [Patescibacteria group bacterium]
MAARKLWGIFLGVMVVGLALFFFAGPGILLVAIAGSEFDRILAPGIEIVNDTAEPIQFNTMSDGVGHFSDNSCWVEIPVCPVSEVQPGDRVIHSHGRYYTGEHVLMLVPMAQEDYWEQTSEFNKGTSSPIYRVRDDIPENAIRVQEDEFLCYQMDVSEARRRWGGLLWRKTIYTYRWSDILEHDECSGA